jgi:hypothetical protein
MNGVKRYPIRGFFAGLCLGLGAAFMLIVTSTIALGTITPLICIVLGIVAGVLWAMFGPVRGHAGGGSPAMAGAPASGAGDMPDAGEPAAGEGPAPE